MSDHQHMLLCFCNFPTGLVWVAHFEHLFKSVRHVKPEPVGILCWVKVNHPYTAQPNIEHNHAHRSEFKTHSERCDINGNLAVPVRRWRLSCCSRTGLAEKRSRIQFIECQIKNATVLPVASSSMSWQVVFFLIKLNGLVWIKLGQFR